MKSSKDSLFKRGKQVMLDLTQTSFSDNIFRYVYFCILNNNEIGSLYLNMLSFCIVLALAIFASSDDGTNETTITTNLKEITLSPNCSDSSSLNFQCIDSDLKNVQSSLLQLLAVTLLSGAWIVYLTFYNSRVVGLVISKLINHFFKDAYFHAGSFSFSALSGKLMFRDVSYVTKDYSVHINDGYCIFRWWHSYTFVELSKQKEIDYNNSRLSIYLYGLECHVYNQAQVYDKLEKLFDQKKVQNVSKDVPAKKVANVEASGIEWWRSLFPVIKFYISPGKFVFGNRLLPNTLVLSFSDGDIQYKTTEASNDIDLFLHLMEANLKSARLMLVPSLGFDASNTPPRLNITPDCLEPPPRNMGDGYVVVHSNLITFQYCWDEPGRVKGSAVDQESDNEDEKPRRDDTANLLKMPVREENGPLWEMDIKFGKHTTFNYGPWADRQRIIIWSFFYPLDYQNLEVTKTPERGELRIASALKIYAALDNGADFDFLFSRPEGIGALQINSGKGSFVKITVPMIVDKSGYCSHITGQLLNSDIFTTLPYQKLLKAETLGFDIKSHFPLEWNGFELWDVDMAASKASLSFVFLHKEFFADLMYDWSYKSHADLMFFVPYTYKFHMKFDSFELFLPVNKHNWVDCQTNPKENAYLALHGDRFDLSFDLPNETFLPVSCCVPFKFCITKGQLCAFLPESNMSRNNLLNLAAQQEKWLAESEINEPEVNWNELSKKSWGLVNSDWVIVGEIPSIKLDLTYTWHPIVKPYKPPVKIRPRQHSLYLSTQQSSRPTSLTVIHSTIEEKKGDVPKPRGKTAVTFDPTSLSPDVLKVDVSVSAGTVLILYGSIIDLVVAFKENYLGYDDVLTDITSSPSEETGFKKSTSHTDNVLQFRPFEVKVNVDLKNISAVLPIHYTTLYECQPRVTLEQLHFEMDKTYLQTRLQLMLVDLNISVKERATSTPDLLKMSRNCRFQLSNLQLRGHAMFSNAGLPLGSVLVEYAWLTEVLIGDIRGLLSLTQMQALLNWLESFIFLSSNESDRLNKAFPNRKLPTGITWDKRKSNGSIIEETDVKYTMTRVLFRSLQVRLAHEQTLFDFNVSPLTIANGNVQEKGVAEAVSVDVQHIQIKHYVLRPSSEEWLEAGELFMGPILSHVYIASEDEHLDRLQDEFLRFHDKKTRRLFFVWEQQPYSESNLNRTSPLTDSVKRMTSWGCAFFSPVSSFEGASYPEEGAFRREQLAAVSEAAATDGDANSERAYDLDIGVDFGMSLLVDGKILMPRKNKSMEDSSGTLASSSLSSSTPFCPVTLDLPSDDIPEKPSPEPSPDDSSDDSDEKTPPTSENVTSPVSQSVASDLFQSAKDDFPDGGAATFASSATSDEEFFSAESDFETDYVKPKSKKSLLVESLPPGFCCNMKKLPEGMKRPHVTFSCHPQAVPSTDTKTGDASLPLDKQQSRPADLALFETPRNVVRQLEPSDLIATEKNRDDDDDFPDVASVVYDNAHVRRQRSSLRDLNEDRPNSSKIDSTYADVSAQPNFKPSPPNPSDHKSSNVFFSKKSESDKLRELSACYSYLLATAKFKDNSDWLPKLVTTRNGIHPSVIVETETQFKSRLKRRSSLDLFRTAQLEDCTSVILHVKGGVNIQVSPFLVDSIHEIVDALTLNATQRHPSSILGHLQAKCTRDAILDYQLHKLNPDLINDVFANALSQGDGSKTKLKIFMDEVRVNIVQATPGDEDVFNLHRNKMLPTPCLTVAALRLDRLDVSAQLNSKKDKLIKKARDKRLSHFSESDDFEEANPGELRHSFVIFSARAAIHSVACQLRVLSHNGCVPDRSNIVALSDESCRSPFKFNEKLALPHVKEAIKNAGYQRRPAKPWGWVMFEAGINTISAQLLKHDMPVEDSTLSQRHLTEGYLTVETLWLNAVTPQSSSQQSKVNKTYRTWNLLTTLAPSCCAWLGPAERLIDSLQKFNKTATDRYFTTIAASLTLASKSILGRSKGLLIEKKKKREWEEKIDEELLSGWSKKRDSEKKFTLFSDLSNAIKADPSCILCDSLQLHFRDHDKLAELEAALADERNLPTTASLELGIRMMLAQFVRLESKPLKKQKSKKGRPSYTSTLSVPAPQSPLSWAHRDDDIIEMSSNMPISASQVHHADTSVLINSPVEEKAENLIFEQQKSGMYSWMQNQNKIPDVESQRVNGGPSGNEAMLTESMMREAADTFFNFLTNAGVENVSKDRGNLLQSFCGGSIALHANVATIRMEKQSPDSFYVRGSHRRSTMRENKHFTTLSETPVIACHSLAINSSLVDSPLSDEANDRSLITDRRKSSNFNTISTNSNLHRFLKNRSTLSVEIICSIEFVKQRIDIALVRLVHQFLMTVTIIQQHLTDMKVTKYTEGALSPDPYVAHRQDLSAMSASILDSPSAHHSFRLTSQPLRRRLTSDRTPHHVDTDSLSDESLAPLPFWQDLYRLIDQHQPDFPEPHSYDTMRLENDKGKLVGNYMDKTPSFVLLKLSSSVKLNKIQLVAEVGDMSLSIMLMSLHAGLKYTKTGVSLIRSEIETEIDASLNEVVADLSDNSMKSKKSILNAYVGLCSCGASVLQPDLQARNKCVLKVGKISVDLPQRPSSIHEVVTRNTRRLSVHIQEFALTPGRRPSFEALSALNSVAPSATNLSHMTPITPFIGNVTVVDGSISTSADGVNPEPLIMKVELIVEGVEFSANLVPASIVRYKSEIIIGSGQLGPKGSFNVRLLQHALHLNSPIQSDSDDSSGTAINLPRIVAEGEIKDHHITTFTDVNELQLKSGEFMLVSVNVGNFEQTLNTSVVNQIIFLEEVVVHELGDILSKMTKNVGATSDTSLKTAMSSHTSSGLLYQLQLHLDGIQVTAVTPSRSAVRLKTGTITFELSNRVLRANQNQREKLPKYMKLFGKAQVDLNLGLGTLIYNNVYPETEPEFQQLAYFKTKIGLQNTTQTQEGATLLGVDKSGEDSNILIHVMRPIFFVQPTAFDKAILFFLVYKNAYDDWTERREALENSFVPMRSTSQMLTALQSKRSNFDGNATSSSLSLQLAVDDLGICLPVSKDNSVTNQDELSSALVLTIDNSMINLYYARSLVSAGQFVGFCLRFADDFQMSWDDWAPKQSPANSFVVPHGSYQICTDTTSYQGVQMRAKTKVNVVWKMKGIDVKLNSNIGYYLTRVYDTMTFITGDNVPPGSSSMSERLNDSEDLPDADSVFHDEVMDGKKKKMSRKSRKSMSKSKAERFKKLHVEYMEQAQVISDLRSLGAKPQLIAEEEQRLEEISVHLSTIGRRNFRAHLRRSSLKPGSSSEVGFRPSHHRSVSAGLTPNSLFPVTPLPSPYATLPPATDPHSFKAYRKKRSKSRKDSMEEISSDASSDIDQLPELKSPDVPVINLTQHDNSAPVEKLKTESADLELVLDVRVVIDGGKIVCHPHNPDLSASNSSHASSRFTANRQLESNETVFYVPGVTIKCRYNSTGTDASHPPRSSVGSNLPVPENVPQIDIQTPGGSKLSRKRSSIYISFALQSLPETIISPCFLDFLEQTLQAIPVQIENPHQSEEDLVGAVDSLDSTIASLPMDAVVYVSVQPSQVLFNCLPMSRVECLLRIPSLDACFSNIQNSKEMSMDFPGFVFPDDMSDSDSKTSDVKRSSKGSKPSDKTESKSSKDRKASDIKDNDKDGNAKVLETKAFPSGLAITVVMADFSIYVFHPYGAQVYPGGEQKIGSGRKDSLSVDLEVVRINFVRSKKGSANVDSSFLLKDKASVVNMSVLIDIGSACFKYDMRRLNEILAIPRAWYRRSIARRLFFGDTTDERPIDIELNFPESPSTPQKISPNKPASAASSKEEWVSVVLYCLKMSRLDVQMNMSNVMGNTLWSCDDLRSQGKLSAQSNGDQDIFLSCGLGKSQLSARGGIIGGHLELRDLYANCRVLEPIESEPRHKLNVKMRSLDGRIEYMGGCIMIGKLTKVNMKMSDEWKGPKTGLVNQVEKCSVFVPADFTWENFSLAISRSTTPDVIKMLAKLEEFFTQQFQSSVLAITSLTESNRANALSWPSTPSHSPNTVYAFYRHWPSLYDKIRSLNVTPSFLLGGSFCLRGSHLTISCFHGNNFRSKTWILFNILEPNIMFSTEVQEIKESIIGNEASIFSIQSLTFNLGHDYWLKTSNTSSDPMATVSRVTRSRSDNPPPNSASIDEWFAYITASHTQELTMLRTLNDISNEGTRLMDPFSKSTPSSQLSSYTHDTDIIFAMPKLQLDFKTEHVHGPTEPDPKNPEKPVVDCSFVTEFTDHICVTMDIELIMCLHDLISSYLKEKQQALSSRPLATRDHHVTVDPVDIREFVCNTWQLEPTIRLISWAGRKIEPVGVDFILQKLGFRHARTTIPKWCQRGVLDVLDHTLAVIVQNLLVAMHQRKRI